MVAGNITANRAKSGSKIHYKRGADLPGGANIWFCQNFQKKKLYEILDCEGRMPVLSPLDPPLRVVS